MEQKKYSNTFTARIHLSRLIAGSLSLPYDIFTVEVRFRSDKILPVLQGTTKV